MRVRDLMTQAVVPCRSETNLAAVAALMWEYDCGAIPVVTDRGKVIGVVTDRDICIALGTRDKPASSITAGELTSKLPLTCQPDDEIRGARKAMCAGRIRRLPVVDSAGKLCGILSMNDLVLWAQHCDGAKRPCVSYEDVVNTMVVIGLHEAGRADKMLRSAF